MYFTTYEAAHHWAASMGYPFEIHQDRKGLFYPSFEIPSMEGY